MVPGCGEGCSVSWDIATFTAEVASPPEAALPTPSSLGAGAVSSDFPVLLQLWVITASLFHAHDHTRLFNFSASSSLLQNEPLCIL